MKVHTLCACLVVLVLVSPTAFGIIVETGDWDSDTYGGGSVSGGWDYTSAHARARGTQSLSWAGGEGSQEEYTTEAGDFSFFYTAYVYTEVQLTLFDDQFCSGTAYASASAFGPQGSLNYTASTQFGASGEEGHARFDDDGPYTNYFQGTAQFSPYQGVGGNHYVVAAGKSGDSILISVDWVDMAGGDG